MADSKLSALTPLAVEPDATDQLYVNDGGVSKRIAYSVLEAAICDTTNVTAAGALMDSEVTNLAAVKAFDPADYATAAQGTTADSALQDVVSDTTPQLGGNLDVNGNKIVSASNGNIDIEPNGTGNVLLGNFTFDADQTVGAGQDNYVLTYDNGTGLISLEAAAGGGSGDFLANGTVDMTGALGTDVGTFRSDVADGASAVGFLFNTTNAYSTSGAKIASFKNNSVEKFYINKDGDAVLRASAGDGVLYLDNFNASSTPTKIQSISGGYGIEIYNRYSAAVQFLFSNKFAISATDGIYLGGPTYAARFYLGDTNPQTLNGSALDPSTNKLWIATPYGGAYTNNGRHAINMRVSLGAGGDPPSGVTTGGNAGKLDVLLNAGGVGAGGAANGADGAFRILDEGESSTIFEAVNGGNVRLGKGFTVSGLPATPIVGMIARVTDANAPSVGSTVAGSGAAAALCWYNGSNWTVIGV